MSSTTSTTQSWQDLVALKQQQTRAAIPNEWILPASITDALKYPLAENPNRLMEADIPRRSGILTDRELDITEKSSVEELLERLASGSLSSLEVTLAFSKRAAIAQQLTSCLTEIFFEEAQERAKKLDEIRAQGQVVGPLHGLPISLKDCQNVVGQETTVGYAAWVGNKATENSTLVDVLLELGAVLYVKTNLPQTMMTADSENNLFGRTLNPLNTSLSAGGSSGGEGALVGFRGSLLGVGTDVAGSIRIPAICCGTYGFKPTASRIPDSRQAGGAKGGMRFIRGCVGPLATDISALQIFCKAVLDADPFRHDINALDIPWRTTTRVTGKPSLRIGLLSEDPRFPLLPPVRRALAEAADLIRAAGHVIVPLDPAQCHVADALEVGYSIFNLADDTAARLHTDIGEPLIKSIAFINCATDSVEHIYTADADATAIPDRLDRLAALTLLREQIMDAWRALWTDLALDAVLGPGTQNVALPHDTFGAPAYTLLCNLLDYPACVIPFQQARPHLDPDPVTMQPGQHGPPYDPAVAAGMPCSLQVFTSRLRDEECLEVARVIDGCLSVGGSAGGEGVRIL